PPRRLRRRAAQLQVDPDRPRRRPPPGPPRGARPAKRGRLRTDPRDVREGARGGAPGSWAIAVARRPRRADPRRLDRGEATAHRAVVLLSGAHGGPVWPSRRDVAAPPGIAMSRA